MSFLLLVIPTGLIIAAVIYGISGLAARCLKFSLPEKNGCFLYDTARRHGSSKTGLPERAIRNTI